MSYILDFTEYLDAMESVERLNHIFENVKDIWKRGAQEIFHVIEEYERSLDATDSIGNTGA